LREGEDFIDEFGELVPAPGELMAEVETKGIGESADMSGRSFWKLVIQQSSTVDRRKVLLVAL